MGKTPGHDDIRRRWAETYGDVAPSRTRRRGRGAGAVVVVVIALVGVWFWLRPQADQTPPALPGPVTTSTPVPLFDPAHPYGQTPAARWADGPAGIVLPAPAAIGSYSAHQVGAAEAKVKQVLIAGHLDHRMLVNHDPSTFLSLLAPDARTDARTQLTRAGHHDYGGGVTELAPGYHLLNVPIKVDGSMSPRIGEHGNLVVHTNYVFAFPFAPTTPLALRDAWETVAVQHVQIDFEIVTNPRYRTADRGVWLEKINSYDADIGCAAAQQGYLAPEFTNSAITGGSTEDPSAMFDPNHPMKIADTCH
jgi:hypothetical protein